MASLAEHVVAGLAAGGVYALLALGLVLVHRAGGIVNVAQGELATLSAFVCWSLVDHGWSYWPAFALTVALSFGGGALLQTVLVRPLESERPATGIVLSAGLLLTVAGLTTWIWGGGERRLRSAFSAGHLNVGGAVFPGRQLGTLGVALAVAAVLALVLRRTKVGLGLRAASASPLEARHVGIRLEAMRAVAWGLAAALGAVAGVLTAPGSGLDPGLFRVAFVYALAAAVLGGLDSPLGAVLGGLSVGVCLELLGAYVHWVDGSLRPAAALALLGAVLLVRPGGLLGARRVAPA